MVPSDFAKMTIAQKQEIKSGIMKQGAKSESPASLIQSLHKLRKEINPTYVAKLTDYWMDDTRYPKLHITSEIKSSDGPGMWTQEIVFLSPLISERQTAGTMAMPVKTGGGRMLDGEYWFLSPLPVITPIKCRCSCPDFRHTFSWEDFDVNSLSGRRLQYLKTGNRPERNPDHHAGICKHLGSLIHLLQSQTDVLEKSPVLRARSMFY